MSNIIGISGHSQTGKDTMAKYLVSTPEFKNYKIVHMSDTLKEMASLLLNIPRERFEDQDFKKSDLPERWWVEKRDRLLGKPYYYIKTVRDFLQVLGTECMRNNMSENIWVNSMLSKYSSDSKWIIADIRFPNEAEMVKQMNGILVRIERPIPVMDHISEHLLDNYNSFDMTLDNNSSLESFYILINSIKHNLL